MNERKLNLVWHRNMRKGKVHYEWCAPCGCAYHPEPEPHIHPCFQHTDKECEYCDKVATHRSHDNCYFCDEHKFEGDQKL